MWKMVLTLVLFWTSLASAEILNVEFSFTPFIGDPANEHVESVPGKASVRINNVPVASVEVGKEEVPVIFSEREIAPSVWVTADSLGPSLRKGKNTIRVEFEPSDPKEPYRAQLRWVSVTDQITTVEDSPGEVRKTNTGEGGVDERNVTGRVVFEREFEANFAADKPWHHYPPVTALSDDDRKVLMGLVKERTEAFKPNFSALYQILKGEKGIDAESVKKAKCLDKCYAAGLRMTTSEQIEFITTGNSEVLVQGKESPLYYPLNPKTFERIKDRKTQECATQALFALYPPRLLIARTPMGKWEVVH